MKLAQITNKDNIVFDAQTPQQKIMADLDLMSKQARKIKNRKRKPRSYGQSPTGPSSGHLDTQLFPPRSMKAEASEKAKAMFFKREIAQDSYWVVQCKGEEVKLSIGDLFSKGLYDVGEVKSKEFGIALILRLSKGNPKEEGQKLIDENKMQFTEISFEDVNDEEKTTSIISFAIPLNDYQRTIRDSMLEKAMWRMTQNGHKGNR
jgi:hypothetical protein